MSKESAEAELREWATVTSDRDNRVRRAHAEGITKHRIHVLTGISRVTIDRILKEKHVPITKITATAGGPWANSANAWVEAAKRAGYNAEVVEGETVNELNNQPVVQVDGVHYVLARYSGNGIVVHIDYKARKFNGTWTPTP